MKFCLFIEGEVNLTLPALIDETPFANSAEITVIEMGKKEMDVPVETESNENEGSALENLAKNLDSTGGYKNLMGEAKANDIIAFKVFKPNFEKSDYIIGLVETINRRDNPDDYDLILTIMAGNAHVEHLQVFDEGDNQTSQIGINRMDMFDAKLLEL